MTDWNSAPKIAGEIFDQSKRQAAHSAWRMAALNVGADARRSTPTPGRQQTVSEHQQRIGEYLRLDAFDAAASDRLARFLEDEALRLDRVRAWLRDERMLASPLVRREFPEEFIARLGQVVRATTKPVFVSIVRNGKAGGVDKLLHEASPPQSCTWRCSSSDPSR